MNEYEAGLVSILSCDVDSPVDRGRGGDVPHLPSPTEVVLGCSHRCVHRVFDFVANLGLRKVEEDESTTVA